MTCFYSLRGYQISVNYDLDNNEGNKLADVR